MTKLGEGAYGSVMKQKNMAVKKFQKLSHIVQEHTALFYLNDCQYIVHGKGVNYDKLELNMDLYDMSLRKWISNEVCPCTTCNNKIIHDIVCGLVELQDRGLSHSDLKPGNILIIEEPFKVVLGDCGFTSIAKYSKQQRTAQSHRDIIVHNDDKHDMFSLGVIMLELFYNVRPTVHEIYKEYEHIIKRKVKNTIHADLLRKLLHEDRTLRPSAREVLSLLYNESPSKHVVKINIHDIHDIVDQVSEKYGKAKLKSYEILIKKNQKSMNVNRSRSGYNALLMYLHRHTIDVKYIHYYFVAMLCVLASVFNSKSANIEHIISLCGGKINKRKLNEVIHELTNNVEFVNILFHIN